MKRNIAASEAMFKQASALIPGGVNSPVRAFGQVGRTPVYFKSATGSKCTDVDGNEYVDMCQSWGPLVLGHARAEVVEAVRDATQYGLSYGACHEGEVKLAELVMEAFPGFDKVRMVSSGTEAVMTALRLARGVTGRDLILKFEGGYHGHSDGLLVKAGSGLVTNATASSKGIPEQVAASTLVCPFDDQAAVEKLFEQHGKNIAAIIIEPLPANNGLLVQRQEYLQFLRDITKQHGALLIFDEVISGLRLHFGGYGEQVGIQPDMITLGKIIGGGMPVGAVIGVADHMDMLSPLGSVYQAGTLSGNPVSLAAGIATMRILQQGDVYKHIDALGERFVGKLTASGLSYARAQRMGSIVWLYMDEGEFPRRANGIADTAMQRFTKMYHNLLDCGYYLPPSSYEVMFISGAHSETEIDGLADAVLAELQEQIS